jgi:hypothetical protein
LNIQKAGTSDTSDHLTWKNILYFDID